MRGLQIELDWAGENEPEFGTNEGVTVSPGVAKGPAGWPTVIVFAEGESGAEAGPRLWAWLMNEYCGGDEFSASELADAAVDV